jgi:hypothetical protein
MLRQKRKRRKIIHEYHMWEWNFPHSMDENSDVRKSERVAKEHAAHELEKIMLESRGRDQN